MEDKAIQQALTSNFVLLAHKTYINDSQARFKTMKQSHSFLNILNKQNKVIKYTMEKEDKSLKLNFLDVTIRNTGAGKHEFQMHHKNAITNFQIKPNSFVNSSLIRGILKRFVFRAKKVMF